MTVWDWLDDLRAQFEARGDRERVRLTTVLGEAYEYRHKDPDQMLALFEEARRQARALREPWLALFHDYWCLETWIYYKDDHRGLLEHAVRLALEARKPQYEHHPLGFSIHLSLVRAYLCVDPRGYAEEIEQAFGYLAGVVTEEGSDRYTLLGVRQWFTLSTDRLEEAKALCLRTLALADGEANRYWALHFQVDALRTLCPVLYRQGDWDALGEYATVGEEWARRRGNAFDESQLQLWQALRLRQRLEEEPARRLSRLAVARMNRLKITPGEWWFNVLAAYHERGYNLDGAWRVRDRQLQAFAGKGRLELEQRCRLQRCRLLVLMGRPVADEAETTRQTALRLRNSALALEQLERVLRGGPPLEP